MSRMPHRFLPLVAALAAIPAFAQGTSGKELPEVKVTGSADAGVGYNAPTANTATKIEAPLRDIPQTVNVIPQAVIRDQAARSIQDVLRNVPGVGLSHGDGQRDQVTIRGFSAISDQFVDGMRDDALYFRDLSNVEQVEVVKGPAAVLYGRGSSGGLVNRISKKPGTSLSEAALQVGGHHQRRFEADLALAPAGSAFAWRATGAIERADSYRDRQFLDREAFAPSMLARLGERTELLLQADYLSDRRLTDFGIPAFQGRPVDVDPRTYYGAANARDADVSDARVKGAGFTLTHRIDERFTLREAFRAYDYRLLRNNTLVGAVNEAARTASLNHGNVKREEDGWFNQAELVHKAAWGSTSHQILYGVELGRQDKDQVFRTQNNVATVSLFDPQLPVLPVAANAAASSDNLGILTVASAYVQDLVSLGAHWKALAGVRFDRFEQETRERRAGQRDLARTDRTWSPRAGVVYQPDGQQSYYASWSRSYQPSAENFPLAASNAGIDPEETTNKEVGAKLDFLGGVASLTGSLFRLERQHIKITDPVLNRLVPLGSQRTDGVELTFSGEMPGGWRVLAGYAWLDARMTKSVAIDAGQPVLGNRPTLTPQRSGSVWVTKALGSGFGAGAGASQAGNRFANPGNTVTLPAYTVFDALLYYRVGRFDLQLNAYNLADRRYIVSGHGSSPHLNLPGAPRSWQLTARYGF